MVGRPGLMIKVAGNSDDFCNVYFGAGCRNQGCHHSPSRKSDQRYRTVLCKEFDGFGFRINDFGGEARRGPIFLATGGICNKLTGAAQINNVGVGVAKSDFPQHGSTRRGV